MPATKSWLLRIPEIRKNVSQLTVPVIDRAMLERIFGVRKSRAVQLMNAFGAMEAGQTMVIGVADLDHHLAAVQAGAEYEREARRRKRLADALEDLRRNAQARRVRLPASAPVPAGGMPEGITLLPGRLLVSFQDPADLLGKLYGLAQAAAADFEAFRAAVEGAPDPGSRLPKASTNSPSQ